MGSAKHTPGPWKVSGHMVRTECETSWPVASCCYGTAAQSDANARLIAAAPELLAACDAMLNAIADNTDIGFDVDLNEAMRAARAAIVKAKGE